MFASSLSLGLALLPFVVATIHTVQVGGSSGELVYVPDAVSAKVGDQVIFQFNPKNHTVTQSSFASPCGPKAGGFHSGFMPVAANTSVDTRPTFTVIVNDTQPIWIYCSQAAGTPASHCGQGMVFAINCPADGSPNSLANFKKEALAIGASLSSAAAAASATADAGGYGGYGAPPEPSPALTAAYGDVTIPPAVSEALTTVAITLDSSSTWTTVYTSFAGSPAPTPVSAEGAVHTVVVGGTGKLYFSPPSIAASPRDQVVFEFQQKNHSVIQSSFADPCRPINAGNASAPPGFNSGYFPVDPDTTSGFPTWTLTVNDTAPIWVYCGQTAPSSHCGAGMVFAINAVDTSARNFTAFQALAEQLNGTASASAAAPYGYGSDTGTAAPSGSDTGGAAPSGSTSGSNTGGAALSGSSTGGALSLRGSSGVVLALVAVVASLL